LEITYPMQPNAHMHYLHQGNANALNHFYCFAIPLGLVVTILSHLFHPFNTLYNIQPNSHMHYLHQGNANAIRYLLLCNIHAQYNIFHFI
jgi:hypothetical protein